MMKNTLKIKICYRFIMTILIMTLFTSVFNTKVLVSAENINEVQLELSSNLSTLDNLKYNIEKVSYNLLGDVTVKKSEYLYNLDDSADYIYVEFNNGGYAVFLKQTMEMLEYSARGNLDYDTSSSKKYYAGPGSYLIKDNDYFIDKISNQRFNITQEALKQYSSGIRKSLMINYNTIKPIPVNYDYSLTDSKNVSIEDKNEVYSEAVGDKPGLDTSALIKVSEKNGTYIDNYQYFLHDPRHGWNSTGTCGAVAAQLLLSYHNYYSDRRIIDNKYLNGSTSNINSNPNYCVDPMTMTSYTLGTRGTQEDGSDDSNSYFSYVVDKIPVNASTGTMVKGIKNILSERNNEISDTINYSVDWKTGGWFFGLLTVDTSKVISEINDGRPSIILMQKSLGGADHYVVAYGYCNYTYPGSTDSYSGFITHFGWGTNEINVWINSAWCYSYITLNINHEHTYNKVGNIESNPCRVESKCTVCGYRTDAHINVLANDRYTERTVSLPQNGYSYKDYIVNFVSAGNKLFQTFGSKDTMLYLYDMQNNQLVYDDDDGYKLNALFTYYVNANTRYRLRVKFYNSAVIGDVKIGIMPISSTQEKYEDILGPINPKTMISTTSYKGAVSLTRCSVSTEGEYMFYTEKPSSTESITDMCLYLIDPTSTRAALYDDDSAGYLQAKISATLKPGIEYLLITATYNIQKNGPYCLNFKTV